MVIYIKFDVLVSSHVLIHSAEILLCRPEPLAQQGKRFRTPIQSAIALCHRGINKKDDGATLAGPEKSAASFCFESSGAFFGLEVWSSSNNS